MNIPIDLLEQLRPRLANLNNTLKKLEISIINLNHSNTKDLISIQNQFNIALHQLSIISNFINESNSSILSITNVFPNNQFNPNSLPYLLNLLRKKLTPEVEDWISIENDSSPPITSNTNDATTNSISLENDQFLSKLESLNDLIINHATDSLDNYIFNGYLTIDEINNKTPINEVLNIKQSDLDSTPIPSNESSLLKFIYQGL
ncbi:hypothetical protein DAPK24_039430 [Pichia kluyveri]|uniref:Mediator complex subunit 8 n=1 Tax=Pichia kluyveri TaxID=36015 RepID=A0AAV5R997_PICKL|nr:hypothetical protein DAPK24_039430 [Pichia kluyveri]